MARRQNDAALQRVRTPNLFRTPARCAADTRKTPTRRSTTTTRGKILALRLCTTPVVSILVLPVKTPENAFMTAHTAANAHAQWRDVAIDVQLPANITLPCHASELDSRLLRVCMFDSRREIGDFVVPVRSVLERGACIQVGKRSVLDVRGVVGNYSRWGLGIELRSGTSVYKEVKGCSVRMRRVGGGTADVVLGEWGIGREGSCAMSIGGEVLWFGLDKGEGSGVRLVFQVVKKERFGGEQVVGEMQVGLTEIAKLSQGQLLKVDWWRGSVSIPLLAVVESMEMSKRGTEQVLLQLHLVR